MYQNVPIKFLQHFVLTILGFCKLRKCKKALVMEVLVAVEVASCKVNKLC